MEEEGGGAGGRGREGGDWGGWMVGAPFSSVRACPPTCNLQAPALKIFLTYDEHNKHCNTDVNFTTSPACLQNKGGGWFSTSVPLSSFNCGQVSKQGHTCSRWMGGRCRWAGAGGQGQVQVGRCRWAGAGE